MFWIKGKIGETVQMIQYDNINGRGSLAGDNGIIYLMVEEFNNKTVVGPVGQYIEANMHNPLSVLFVAKKCFDSIIEMSGDLPEADEIPKDSIC